MLNRKVLSVALLAIVLLGSLMEVGAGVDRIHKPRRRHAATASGAVAQIAPNIHMQSLTNLMNQATGLKAVDLDDQQLLARLVKPRRPIKHLAAADPDDQQLLARLVKPRRPIKHFAAADPDDQQLLARLIKPRRPRHFAGVGSWNQVAG
jgi:hypothetical protein